MVQQNVIESLEARVTELMESHRKLRSKCRELSTEREALLDQRRALQEQVAVLERKLTASQLREGFDMTSADRDQARSRVNRLMREVDKCISLITSQGLGANEVSDEEGNGVSE